MRTLILFSLTSVLISQNEHIKIGIVGDPFSDFVLESYQGEQISSSALRGKNILLISSRGKYTDENWCGICYYQYAEFFEMELTQQIRKKYNVEIMFLLPYPKDTLRNWEKSFPAGLAYLENVTRPLNQEKLSPGQKKWMQFVRDHYPKTFEFTANQTELILPILADEQQQVSKGLGLFQKEWGGTKAMQNIPAIFIIDKEGILRFKYISQSTTDRPSAREIVQYLEYINED